MVMQTSMQNTFGAACAQLIIDGLAKSHGTVPNATCSTCYASGCCPTHSVDENRNETFGCAKGAGVCVSTSSSSDVL